MNAVSLYTFEELPTDTAKEKAREWGRNVIGCDPAWSGESLDSIKTFCSRFGVTLQEWSIGAYAPVDYSAPFDNANFRGLRLRDFDRDAMPTGYCLDGDLWQTFYDRFKATGDAKGAFDAALYAGFKAWRDDLEGQLEDEYISDFLMANEYEFTEDGDKA